MSGKKEDNWALMTNTAGESEKEKNTTTKSKRKNFEKQLVLQEKEKNKKNWRWLESLIYIGDKEEYSVEKIVWSFWNN